MRVQLSASPHTPPANAPDCLPRTHSLHAAIDGRVKFTRRAEGRVHVSVVPMALAAE
jgi:ribosomal protein L27